MKRLRWQILIVVLALAAIAFLLLSQQSANLPTILDAQPEPEQGGVYTEALVGSMGRLNPLLDGYNAADRDVDRLLYSSLVRFDDHGLPYGDLAESWGISQDGKVYNFSIRENAVWHDGEPVTSDDVIFTIDLLRDEDALISPDVQEMWADIEVIALDEKLLQFRLPEPFAPFLDYLEFGVLPEHLLKGVSAAELVDDDFNLKPVGSGPFAFDYFLAENGQIEGVALKVNEDYYKDRAFIDQVIFRYYPDSEAALQAYRAGEVLGISQISMETLPSALQAPNLNLYTARLPRITMIYFNLDRPRQSFFQDPAVRQALLLGVNRQWIVDRILNGQAIIADGPVFPGTWAYYDKTERIRYDPAAAQDLLKDAGYSLSPDGGDVLEKDGTPLAFQLAYPDDTTHTAQAENIRENWARLGVQVELQAVPYDELVADYLEEGDYEAALVDINLSNSPDPDPYPFWHQAQITGGQNYARWDDRQASEYLETARVLADTGERIRYYRNFQVRFADQMPALPLYYPVYNYAVDNQVQGVAVGPLFEPSDRFNTITSWYLSARSPVEPVLTSTPEESGS